MATVTSLTQSRIEELMAGWQLVGMSQDEINALIVRLGEDVESQREVLTEFNEVVLPLLRDDVAAGAIAVGDLNDNLLPMLRQELATAQADVANITEVVLPSMAQDVANTIQNQVDAPKVYNQPNMPEDPDEEDRYLVRGDVWYDSDDNNFQRIWNGVEWTTFKVDVADFSLNVRKFISSRHQIY